MGTERASRQASRNDGVRSEGSLVAFIEMKRLSFAAPALRRNHLSASQLSGESVRLAGNNLPMSRCLSGHEQLASLKERGLDEYNVSVRGARKDS
jgi:hypothetical protein